MKKSQPKMLSTTISSGLLGMFRAPRVLIQAINRWFEIPKNHR